MSAGVEVVLLVLVGGDEEVSDGAVVGGVTSEDEIGVVGKVVSSVIVVVGVMVGVVSLGVVSGCVSVEEEEKEEGDGVESTETEVVSTTGDVAGDGSSGNPLAVVTTTIL